MQPEDVTLTSDVDDLDAVRQHVQLESAALLGHSWGAVLALEYALRHPTRVSHLVLMNPAPASASDVAVLRKGIVKARAVEDRLMRDTWQIDGYDLLPRLRTLSVPTLVISGDHDFIPGEIAVHIARAIPNARLVTLGDCGHFASLECPVDVRQAFTDFFRHPRATGRPH